MPRLAGGFVVFWAVFFCLSLHGQTFSSRPTDNNGAAVQLQALSKKIDEQNTKIDLLSQQILKLEQQLSNSRPGVMIGEATPAPVATTSSAAPAASVEGANHAGGNTHTVARGETLTSIAKMHNVTVSELQKLNHIENPQKLQIGQTIILPGGGPSGSPSPSE